MQVKILRFLSCLALLLICTFPVLAQTKTITGKVIDSVTTKPLDGVSISAVGTSVGTVSNADGSFRLSVPDNVRQLRFSYVNYTAQNISVSGSKTIVVKLAPSNQTLKEVQIVSVGYGTLDKREVSSAITHVTAEDLKTVAANNPLMALQGKVAGLTISNTSTADPNSSPSVQLRGVSSRSAGLGPLYVVNGVPGGNIDNINQNDIESIDVLKGGAASAIYGTRGSNGVIIITTKKGTSDSKLIYNGYATFDYLTQKPDILSAAEFRQYRVNANPTQGIDYGGNTDWLKAVTRSPTYGQKHTVQLSGGTANDNYFASADYRNANGIDLRAYKKEYGARINVNHTSKDNIYVVTLNVAPRYMHTSNADQGNFNNAITLNPTLPIYDGNGYRYINTGFFSNNPVENARLIQSQAEIKELDLNGSLKVNILKNLNSMVTVSDIRSSYKNLYFSPSTLTTIVHSGQTTKTNYASQEQQDNDQKNIEWTINYSLNVQKHHIKALGGYSYSYFNYQQFSANNYDFPFDTFMWNNLGSGTWNGGGEGNGQNAVASTQNDSRLAAFYGRINYDFDYKYILTASLRHEGSSKFGADNKWGNFPAVSAAWRISEESFLKNKFSWLNDLKLRADYGVTGNQDFGNYLSLLLYGGYGYFPFNGTTYQVYGPSQNVNPALSWEKAINFNAGVDFDMLNGRLTGSLNYYVRTNKDLLGYYNVPLPPNPQSQTFTNVGTMKNSGFEIQLSATPVKTSNFTYNVSFTTAYNNNKFVSFSNDIYQGAPFQDLAGLPSPGSPGTIQRLQEGHRIGEFYMLKSAGVGDNGALLVYDKNGQVIQANQASADDKQFVGNGLPKFTGSLGNTFRYKNWDLNIFFRGNFGYKLFNMQAFYIGTPATQTDANTLKSAYDPKSKYSKLTNSATTSLASDYFLESGSFIKLDNVTLGYSHSINSKYLRAIRVYVSGNNVHTFTSFKGGDPDLYPVNGLTPGVQGNLNFYPATVQLLGGLQATF